MKHSDKDEFPPINEEIQIKCSYTDLVHISQLEPTQGELKVSSPEDLEKLSNSLRSHGYIRPIVLWWDSPTGEKTTKILDGHQRRHLHLLEATKGIGTKDYKVPVIYAKAPTYELAMKVLLQLISTTGDVTAQGLSDFVEKNKFNLSEMVATMSLKSPFLKKATRTLENKNISNMQKNPEYPIQKQFGESHNVVIIFCDNDMDWLWLQNKLKLGRSRDPKSKYVGDTKVIHVSDFQSIFNNKNDNDNDKE